uniref:Uncharacterized protein n=1 Tax=Setaria digitata TaxID=48799 RepID=A0A915Q847_9BILA
MAYTRQPLLVTSTNLEQFLVDRLSPTSCTATNVTNHSDSDEPIYYYTLAQNPANLPVLSSYGGPETSRLHSYRSYDDVYSHEYLSKRNTSTPWVSSAFSRESEARRLSAANYQDCYCCSIDHSQNLTTTFQSRPEDVWQTRKAYYEEEVVIVLKDDVECLGFSMSDVIPGNHSASINSILPEFTTDRFQEYFAMFITGHLISQCSLLVISVHRTKMIRKTFEVLSI